MARGLIAIRLKKNRNINPADAEYAHDETDELRAALRAATSSRAALAFRLVNQKGTPSYDPGLQRHHLLPAQIAAEHCFGHMFDHLGADSIGFEDFRRNGLLLPGTVRTAVLMQLPLHRGPHDLYNAMVMERVGQIEEYWSNCRRGNADKAASEALFRLQLLQQALRRRLLDPVRPLALSKADPKQRLPEFDAIDAMVESLWSATALVQPGKADDAAVSSALAEA